MTGIDIDKLHTTPMGAERIRRNLGISADPVAHCKEQISQAAIKRKGKNWYATTTNEIITINAHSHTIITAHKHVKTE
jgi:hypothetical protein